MREILFRAKRLNNFYKDWLYGCLADNINDIDGLTKPAIIYKTRYNDYEQIINFNWEFVKPQTVGQYTGLRDKNGKKIFEGDILTGQSIFDDYRQCFVCIFIDGGFYFRGEINNIAYCLDNIVSGEVIGNIHDNPELLKEQNYEL